MHALRTRASVVYTCSLVLKREDRRVIIVRKSGGGELEGELEGGSASGTVEVPTLERRTAGVARPLSTNLLSRWRQLRVVPMGSLSQYCNTIHTPEER
jgi:hypothetical protein